MIKRALPPAVQTALDELKQALTQIYGEKFEGLYLYGSYARGDFREDSDVDLAISLKGNVNPYDELDRLSKTISEISFRHDLLLATYPFPAHWLKERQSPLFENIRREASLV